MSTHPPDKKVAITFNALVGFTAVPSAPFNQSMDVYACLDPDYVGYPGILSTVLLCGSVDLRPNYNAGIVLG